ncbi:radical SAM protein [Candidatus Micrarchaeota archaeon]|nr:radical SAM protein [Candidatus Micrarchaeota archaeon]
MKTAQETRKKSLPKAAGSSSLINQKYFANHYFQTLSSIKQDLAQFFFSEKEAYKKFESVLVPGILFFEVTNICNSRCIFCAYKTVTHKKGTMPFSTFKKATDEFVQMGGNTISFTPTAGEPLLDPDLINKIQYAVNCPGIKEVYFFTNGISLTQGDLYRQLVDSGIKEIAISTAGCSQKSFKEVYGVDVYPKLIEGIYQLLKYNNEKEEPVKISINFRPSQQLKDILESPDFKKYIQPYLSTRVRIEFLVNYDNWGGTIKKENLKGVMKLRRIPMVKNVPCTRTFDLMVLFDGSVRLCASRFKTTEFDDLVVGNVNEKSLSEIYYGKKVLQIREGFLSHSLPSACKDCSLYLPATKKWLLQR